MELVSLAVRTTVYHVRVVTREVCATTGAELYTRGNVGCVEKESLTTGVSLATLVTAGVSNTRLLF